MAVSAFGRARFGSGDPFGGFADDQKGRVLKIALDVPAVSESQGRLFKLSLDVPAPSSGRLFRLALDVPAEPAQGRLFRLAVEVPDADRLGRLFRLALETPGAASFGRLFRLGLDTPGFERFGRVFRLSLRTPRRPAGTGGPIVDNPDTPGGIDPDTGDEVMAIYDRTLVLPTWKVTWPETPRGFESVSITGKVQSFAGSQAGRVWQEHYRVSRNADPAFQRMMGYIEDLFQNERHFMIDYRLTTFLGSVAGSPVVSGAGQTGYLIAASGWTGVIAGGNLLQIAGLRQTFRVVLDVTAPNPIPINPMIHEGGSPVDGAAITLGPDVRILAKISRIIEYPEAAQSKVWIGFAVEFREVL